ncbi:response regulator transcription factor [Nakamurella sp. A5-74]|uniref:Response regulator transcription factor n=1 Tax=Nakamurella sp. A5-74 TaxID=3158264 RepID=A0AAU8DLY9_9ACTN
MKPFVMAELLARIRAVLRRAGHLREPVVQISDLVVDENTGEASRAGSFLSLTATEFRLLAFLARHPGRVLSKAQILSQVWGYDAYDPNLVEAFVSALRRKIEAHGPRLIHTVRGVGYRIGEPRTDPADGTTS